MNNINSPSLEEVQKWMRWIITDPRGVNEALAEPAPINVKYKKRYTAPERDCLSSIANYSTQRLDIYAEAYFSRILEALSEDFIALKQVLSISNEEDAFTKLIAEYLKAHPSHTPNMGEVGRNMNQFLVDYELTTHLPFLPELAKLEWLTIESFYADDVLPIDFNSLHQISEETWAKVHFRLDPSVFLLEQEWPVENLWNARDTNDLEEKLGEMKKGKTFKLIYRSGGHVYVEPLRPAPFETLRGMSQGLSLSECCETTSLTDVDASALFMELFSKWIQLGIIREVIL